MFWSCWLRVSIQRTKGFICMDSNQQCFLKWCCLTIQTETKARLTVASGHTRQQQRGQLILMFIFDGRLGMFLGKTLEAWNDCA